MGLELVEIVLATEDELDLKLPEELSPERSIDTAGDLYAVILGFVREQHPERFESNESYPDQVWRTIRIILHECVGTELEEIKKESRLDEDVGIQF